MKRLLQRRHLPQRADGQALVELALVLPMLTIFVFTCFQFVVLFLAYLSVMNDTRDAARWLAVHPNTVDATAIAAFKARVPPNINANKLAITLSPPCTSLSATGKCAGRPAGSQLMVRMQYDAASLFFLPNTYGSGNMQVTLPTTLPPYTMYVVVEPSP